MQKLDAIIVLGGELVKEGGIWRSAHFNAGAHLGDRLRVIAAYFLYQDEVAHNPELVVVASGGRGGRGALDAPTLASVIKKELLQLGVPAESVVAEEKSNTTYEQLQECERMTVLRGWETVAIISNDYHLPRIQALCELVPKFPHLKAGLERGRVLLMSAEQVAIAHAPTRYRKMVEDAYRSNAMKMRKQREAQGVADLRAGRYAVSVTLRKADRNDLPFLFTLRNEPRVRQASFTSEPIALTVHTRWLREKLASHTCLLLVAEHVSEPVGQIRFDVVTEKEAEVNVALSPIMRGKGYGRQIIRHGTMLFLQSFPRIRSVRAYIKPDNEASVHSFTHAGYRQGGTSLVKGHECITMRFENPS